MKFRLNYIVIPVIAFITLYAGSFITRSNLDWYATLDLPAWTPPGSVIGWVWTSIFILTTIAVLIIWNKFPDTKNFKLLICLFITNALLNALWSFLFFGLNLMGVAFIEALLLESTVVALISLIWWFSKPTSLLLFPYAIWVVYASYLTYTVWLLN